MAKRLKPGDVLEVKPEGGGYGYVQFLGKHAELGDTILVCPKKFSEQSSLDARLFAEAYVAFSPIGVAVSRGLASVVGRVAVDRAVPTRLKRPGISRPGEVQPWVIEGGAREVVKPNLSDEERQLPVAGIWNHGMLLYRIEEGWRPEIQGAVAIITAVPVPRNAGTPTKLKHYLYATTQADGAKIAAALSGRGFTTQQSAEAEEGKWLVLAHHEVVLSEELVSRTRAVMEGIAKEFGAEYDGWEADVGR